MVDNETLSKLISDNYSRLVLTVDADFEGEKTFNPYRRNSFTS